MRNRDSNPSTTLWRRWRGALAALAFAGLLAPVGAQDVTLYSFSTSTGGTLHDMTGANTLIAPGGYVSGITPIGFPFTYEGASYSNFSVNNYGGMRLGGTVIQDYQVQSLALNAPVILPFSEDGDETLSSVSYTVDGSPPSRTLIIQWIRQPYTWDGGTQKTFQAFLHEGSNVIEFRYGNGTLGSAWKNLVAIGGADEANFLNVRPGHLVSSVDPTSLDAYPGAGRVYTFSPPAPCTTPAPGNTMASVTSGCPGISSTLTLQNPVPGGGVSYQWQSSPNGVDTWTNVGTSSATHNTGVLMTTTWFQCLVTCSTGPSTVASTPVEIIVSAPAPSYSVFAGVQITEDFASWGDRCSTNDVPSSAGNQWTNFPAQGPGTWRRNDQGGTAGWNNTSGGFFNFDNGAVAPTARFHSREGGSVQGMLDYHIDMTAGTGGEMLRFEYINSFGNGTLEVLVSQNGGTTFTTLGTLGASTSPPINAPTNSWVTREFVIGSTSATTVIRLKGTAGVPANANDIGVDNFRILPAPTCVKPTALAANVNGPGSVSLTWNCASCTDSYIVEYGPTGFVPGTGAAAGTNGTVVTAPGSPANLAGVPAGNYDVYVRQDCGAGDLSENSTKATFAIVAGDHCSNAINLATLPLTDWSTVANTTGALNDYTSTACAAAPGPDVVMYYDVEAGATLSLGLWSSANSIMVAIGGNCPGTTSLTCASSGYLPVGEHVQIVNDYETLIWTNAGCQTERLYVLADGIGAGGPLYVFNHVYTPPAGPVCSAVTGLAVSTVNTGNGANVSWNASCSGNVIIEHGLAGFTPGVGGTAGTGGTTLAVNGTSTALSGLTLDAAYDVYVRQDCGAGVYSANSPAVTFTLLSGDDCSRVITLTGESGSIAINTTGANNDISICDEGNAGGDLVLAYTVQPDHGIYFTSFPEGPYTGQVRIAYGAACPGDTELYCASGGADHFWLNETGAEQTVYFIQDGDEEGATTVEWAYFEACALLDSDGDGINDCDDTCIELPGQIGDPCTVGGVPGIISADCACTLPPCAGNEVVVVIHTDGEPGDLSWEIIDASDAVIAAGVPAGANQVVSETVCLGAAPEAACYSFRLFDSFGDGIANGGWELRTTDGGLLLRDDFSNGSQSPSATPTNPNYTAHSLCLPAGPGNIAPTECGIFNNALGNKVYANKVAGASNYQFEFTDPDAGFIRRIARPYNYVHFWDMVSTPLVPGVKYFARVRTDRDGPMQQAHFGTGCEMGIGLPQVVACSELIQAPAYGHSCNETRAFNTNNSFIWAKPVTGATEYQFRVFNTEEGYDQTFIRSTYILQLKWNSNVAPALTNGYTYQVEINVKVNGLYSGFCASSCTITIDNSGGAAMRVMETAATGHATLWPNPVRDGQVNLSLDGLAGVEQTILVDIQDIYGKQVFAKEYGNSGERFSTVLELGSEVASGVYLVGITVNGERTVQRLSVIR